jgi:hypothetical protein
MGRHCNAARRPRILQDFTTAMGGDIHRRPHFRLGIDANHKNAA